MLFRHDLVVRGLDFKLVGASWLGRAWALNSHEMNRELCADRNADLFKRLVNLDRHSDPLTVDSAPRVLGDRQGHFA